MASTSSNKQLMANRPKPAPIPTAQQRLAAEEGGKLIGPRKAADAVAATDSRLKDSTVRFFSLLTWRYRPGRIYRGAAKELGEHAGLAYRTTKQAVSELKRYGYLARLRGGWIVPIVEQKLPPEERAGREQATFPFIEWDTSGAAKYLSLAHSEAVDNPEPEGQAHAPPVWTTENQRGKPMPLHPTETLRNPTETRPAGQNAAPPAKAGAEQGELFDEA